MEGQGAEIAPAEAAPVVADGEPHLLDGGDALGVHGMHLAGKGQVIEPVQRLPVQGTLGRIHQQPAALTLLQYRLAPDGVVLVILHLGGLGIGGLVVPHLLEGGTRHLMIPAHRRVGDDAGGAADVGDVAHWRSRRQTAGDLHRSALPHAVHQQVGGGVKQDGTAHLVVPVVIVGKPPQ